MPTTTKPKEAAVTPLAELSKKSQDQVLGAVTSVQNTVATGYTKLGGIVTGLLPKSLPSVPAVPFAPKPAEVVELSFGFAEKLLASQKAFVGKLLASPAPVAPAAKAAAAK